MSKKARVLFFYQGVRPGLRGVSRLKENIEAIFKREGRGLDKLVYVFCSDSQLLSINREYLKHDDYTDIISFDLSEGEKVTGEIYISWDRVKENAGLFGETFSREVRRVIFHGALHLCGYKDKRAIDQKLMRQKEQFYLDLFGF